MNILIQLIDGKCLNTSTKESFEELVKEYVGNNSPFLVTADAIVDKNNIVYIQEN